MFRQIDPVSNMPTNSAILGLLLSAVWLVYFYGANLTDPWFLLLLLRLLGLPIVTLYAMYLPIFVSFMRKEADLPVLKRFVPAGPGPVRQPLHDLRRLLRPASLVAYPEHLRRGHAGRGLLPLKGSAHR